MKPARLALTTAAAALLAFGALNAAGPGPLSYFDQAATVSVPEIPAPRQADAAQPSPRAAEGLSPKAVSLLDARLTHHGPNCWNAALIGAGVLEQVRFTSSLELQSLLDSPICQEVGDGAQRAGDIQVFYRGLEGLDKENLISHANVWLDESTAFNKMTQYYTQGHALTPHREVMEKYQYFTDILIFNVRQEDGSYKQVRCPPGTVCEAKIKFHRCRKDLRAYFHSAVPAGPALSVFERLRNIEKILEENIFSPRVFTKQEAEALRAELQALRKAAGEKKPGESPQTEFLRNYTSQAVDSALAQLDYRQPDSLR